MEKRKSLAPFFMQFVFCTDDVQPDPHREQE